MAILSKSGTPSHAAYCSHDAKPEKVENRDFFYVIYAATSRVSTSLRRCRSRSLRFVCFAVPFAIDSGVLHHSPCACDLVVVEVAQTGIVTSRCVNNSLHAYTQPFGVDCAAEQLLTGPKIPLQFL